MSIDVNATSRKIDRQLICIAYSQGRRIPTASGATLDCGDGQTLGRNLFKRDCPQYNVANNWGVARCPGAMSRQKLRSTANPRKISSR
jgi:hypothetical protein